MNELWNWLSSVNPLLLLTLFSGIFVIIGGCSFLYFLEWSIRREEKGDDKDCP